MYYVGHVKYRHTELNSEPSIPTLYQYLMANLANNNFLPKIRSHIMHILHIDSLYKQNGYLSYIGQSGCKLYICLTFIWKSQWNTDFCYHQGNAFSSGWEVADNKNFNLDIWMLALNRTMYVTGFDVYISVRKRNEWCRIRSMEVFRRCNDNRCSFNREWVVRIKKYETKWCRTRTKRRRRRR